MLVLTTPPTKIRTQKPHVITLFYLDQLYSQGRLQNKCMYGPEGAIETTSVSLVGENCHSTSLVTISQLSDFVVKALSTHSSLALNSLSTSYEDLSCIVLFAIVVHELFSRGCLIPSWICSL
ncbi:hypothetical protein YC2023_084812 [Brassica napus]